MVDLKSGVGQAGISDDQQRQLLIYAHLVLTAYGSLPNDVVIQDVRGREEKREVEGKEVQRVVAQVNEAIDSFNQMLDDGSVDARPGPEACQWCPFRVVCDNYWKSRDDSWPRLDVRGVVTERTGRDSACLDLASGLPDSTTFRLLLTPGVKLLMGEEVVALDLERRDLPRGGCVGTHAYGGGQQTSVHMASRSAPPRAAIPWLWARSSCTLDGVPSPRCPPRRAPAFPAESR